MDAWPSHTHKYTWCGHYFSSFVRSFLRLFFLLLCTLNDSFRVLRLSVRMMRDFRWQLFFFHRFLCFLYGLFFFSKSVTTGKKLLLECMKFFWAVFWILFLFLLFVVIVPQFTKSHGLIYFLFFKFHLSIVLPSAWVAATKKKKKYKKVKCYRKKEGEQDQ